MSLGWDDKHRDQLFRVREDRRQTQTDLIERRAPTAENHHNRSRGRTTRFFSGAHRHTLNMCQSGNGNVSGRRSLRDDPAGWEIEEQDVREIPENTGAGDGERSDDYDDELKIAFYSNGCRQLGRQQQNKPHQKLAETRSIHASAHKQTQNVKREAARKGERTTRTRFQGHDVYNLATVVSDMSDRLERGLGRESALSTDDTYTKEGWTRREWTRLGSNFDYCTYRNFTNFCSK